MMLLITLVSLTAAAALGTLAWRLAQDERRRSDARVATLTASLLADAASDAEREPQPGSAGQRDALDLALDSWSGESRASHLDSDTAGDADAARPLLAAAGVATAVFVTAAAIAWVGARAFDPPTAPAVAAAPSAPLELLALTSTRRGADITVAGLVRNPAAGSRLDGVSAVVLFFDARGAFLTSARARLDVTALAPGGDCPFLVRAAAPDEVSRYRVSFRADSGNLVEHVDRRSPSDERDGDQRGRNTHGMPDAAVRRAGL